MKSKKIIRSVISGGFEYSYRWGSLLNIFGVVFSGVFLCTTSYSLYISRDNIAALLFASIFVIVIAVVFYAQLCWLINRSKFRLTENSLEITTFPLPWAGTSKIVRTAEIQKVYTQKFKGGRRGMVIATIIIRGDGTSEELFRRWNNVVDALYFQNELKTFLNITESVDGELTL